MSVKEPRPLTEIQQEYHELCTRAGHIQYQISALKIDLDLVNASLREVNLEAFEAQKAEKAAQAAAAEAPKSA